MDTHGHALVRVRRWGTGRRPQSLLLAAWRRIFGTQGTPLARPLQAERLSSVLGSFLHPSLWLPVSGEPLGSPLAFPGQLGAELRSLGISL